MKKLTLGTLLAIVVASILVATGSGAKPAYSITCTSAAATLTWPSGTTGADFIFYSGTDGSGSQVANGHTNISPHGPGSTLISTTGGAAPVLSASATFTNNKGTGARLAPSNCT